MVRGKISVKKLIKALAITLILEALAFYVVLPPINIYATEFWKFQGVFLVLFLILNISMPDRDVVSVRYNYVSKYVGWALAIGVVIYFIGNITSAEIFNAKKYASLITIEETNFGDAIQQTDTVDNIALMDTTSAQTVGQRAIGSLSDIVSQYEISKDYNQIALNGKPMKVASLEYAGFFKWWNNRSTGVPGYVLVDAVQFETEYVKLDKPIKYTPSGYFNDNLERHLRFKYPTAIFNGYYFELDEEGNPFYVCPVMGPKISMFGGYDVKAVVVCDPCTGDTKYYELDEIPNWIDRVYDGDLIVQKYNWYGLLADGFWNSVIGLKDCKKVTEDYGFKVIDNDVWVYTGVTSVIDDSSNIGFVMVNSRTGQAKYFKVAGAEEFSAMEAAEGQVQHLGYSAAFPSLINIDGEPTYFMVLKDKGNLVKQYALVNVKKYSIVAIGTTQKETLTEYRKLLRENDIDNPSKDKDISEIYDTANIVVKDIKYIDTEEGTCVYITDKEGVVYKKYFAEDETLIFIQAEDKITINYEEDEDTKIREIEAWTYTETEEENKGQ